jgi:hypothetical protein
VCLSTVTAEADDQKYGNRSGEVKADRLHFVVKLSFYVLGVLVRGHLDVTGEYGSQRRTSTRCCLFYVETRIHQFTLLFLGNICLFWSNTEGERDWEEGDV